MVIEEEDEELKTQRLAKEKHDKLEMIKILDEEVEEWQKTKYRERELRDMKRGRDQDPGETVEAPGKPQEGGKRRRIKVKKLGYSRIGVDWGENGSNRDMIDADCFRDSGSQPRSATSQRPEGIEPS